MSNAKNLATFLQSGGSIAGDANFDSNTLFVDSSANRVGIGNASPTTALDVTGTITSDGLTLDNNGSIIFNDPQATDTILIGTNDDDLVIRADAGDIVLKTNNNSTSAVVDASGNVGVGTSSPSGLMSFAKGSRTLDLKLEDSPATGDSGVQFRAGSGDFLGLAAGGGTGVGIVLDDSNNVGIGNSSAQTRLFVGDGSGTEGITIYSGTTGEGQLRFADGTSGSALYQGRVEYNHSTNKLFLGAGGTTPIAIDSNGNFGIGTSSPSEQLEIFNSANETPATFSLYSGDTSIAGTQEIGAIYGKGKDSGGSAPYTGAKITFSADGTWDTGTNYYYPTAIKFYTQQASGTDNIAAGPRMTITSDGSVGIGNSSPDTNLEISDTSGAVLRLSGHTGGAIGVTPYDIGSIEFKSDDNSGEGPRVVATVKTEADTASTVPGGELVFETRGAGNGASLDERMRIDSSGNVGIGTGGSSPSAILDVGKSNNAGDVDFRFFNRGAGSANSSVTLGMYPTNTATRGGEIITFADDPGSGRFSMRFLTSNTTAAPAERMRISQTGQLFLFTQTSGAGNATLKYTTGTGAVTYDTSSRLVKENIVDCPYGLTEVVQLQPRKYFRTDDQANEVGLIADEVQSIMPEFVPTGEKSLITGIEEDTEIIPLGVNYDKMVAPLVQAIKDLNAKIETLETKVATLEGA